MARRSAVGTQEGPPRRFAAPSIPASRPRKAWSRNSTRSTPSVNPGRRISRASSTKAGLVLADPLRRRRFSRAATMGARHSRRLMSDIEAGKVDCVVVYKVDRLSRSLLDFAKMVGNIRSTASRGFCERHATIQHDHVDGTIDAQRTAVLCPIRAGIISERTRDKIAASKKKGMWMGGYPPLGYDVKDRKLVVNETEAETVRCIFRRYTGIGLGAPAQGAPGWSRRSTSKRRMAPDGRPYGRQAGWLGARSTTCCRTASIAARSCTSTMPIQGSTAPIVDEGLWQKVQATLGGKPGRSWRRQGQPPRKPARRSLDLRRAMTNPSTPSSCGQREVSDTDTTSPSASWLEALRRARERASAFRPAHIEALVAGRIRAWLAGARCRAERSSVS